MVRHRPVRRVAIARSPNSCGCVLCLAIKTPFRGLRLDAKCPSNPGHSEVHASGVLMAEKLAAVALLLSL
ncbi:MAG: hypothetical protein BGO95_00945 [Micrococcales bacterium 73-13]|nr:MAG: hypothetical protein BGO95_00945 [Micrococcales bacterium 73-13]